MRPLEHCAYRFRHADGVAGSNRNPRVTCQHPVRKLRIASISGQYAKRTTGEAVNPRTSRSSTRQSRQYAPHKQRGLLLTRSQAQSESHSLLARPSRDGPHISRLTTVLLPLQLLTWRIVGVV